MKKLFFIAVMASLTFVVGCERESIPGKIYDKPSVEFYEESMTVAKEGGEMIIPVLTTGVDNVSIQFQYGDSWSVDTENGDLTPQEGWIKLIKVIDQYDVPTRALAKWDSGLSIEVEPNDSGKERRAWISVRSFGANDTIIIVQSAEQ